MEPQEIDISKGWEFVRGKASKTWLAGEGDLPGTEIVDLPHCWNTRDTFQDGLRYYRGYGCYRKRVPLPDNPTGAWYLDVGPFYGGAEIRVNGRKITHPQDLKDSKGGRLKYYEGGFLGFSTRFQSEDAEVTLTLRVENRHHTTRLPGIREPDFVLHGGLAGPLTLHTDVQSSLEIGLVEISSTNEGRVSVELAFYGYRENNRTMGGRLKVLRNEEVLAELEIPEALEAEQKVELQIDQPDLWSPDHPHLYVLQVDWLAYGYESDEAFPQTTRYRFGFREMDWRANEGFFLNGERFEIRGINRHEKMPGMGNALPPGMHREDARLIKELGLNAVRLSHYPQSPDFLDACDELGILVYAEICTWKSMKRGQWATNAGRQLIEMIVRDLNHPSIMCWGLANESRDAKVLELCDALVKAFDPSRPTIYAENHLYRAKRKKTYATTDLYGVNYELDPEVLEEARDLSANQLLLVSEVSNCPKWRGDIAGELEQIALLEENLEKMKDRPYLTGYMIWCMNDYATMRKDRYRRPSGVFDAWRTPKFAAHYLRALFNPEPNLFAWADWGTESARDERDVYVWTNQSPVHVGDTDLQVTGFGHLQLPFSGAPLRITAGEETFVIPAFGEPKGLTLYPERHDDFIRIVVRVVDADGHPVLNAQGQATVTVDGPLVYHAWNSAGTIDLTRGEGAAYFGIPTGPATFTVSMPGISSAELILDD